MTVLDTLATADAPATGPVVAIDRPSMAVEPAAKLAAPTPSWDSASVHAHGNRCYWDFRECGWVCTP